MHFPLNHPEMLCHVFMLECCQSWTAAERYMFSNVISDEYLAHMTVNNLPAAYEVRVPKQIVVRGTIRSCSTWRCFTRFGK